jgi:GT2 family glycosyltransferase
VGILGKVKTKVTYSFIIPVKDQREYTRDCLLSLYGFTSRYLRESEILIVDDGSVDPTTYFLSTLGEPVRVLTNPENIGFARSNNQAVQASRGEIIILINNDLVFQRNWFEPMLKACLGGSNDRIVGNVQRNKTDYTIDHAGKYFEASGIPRHFGQWHQELFPWMPEEDFLEFPSITAACWMMKKTVFERLGGFDEGYVNGFEDDDLCMRASELNIPCGVALNSMVYHYVSRSSGRKTHENANEKRFLERWGDQAKAWHSNEFEALYTKLSSWSLNDLTKRGEE